MNIENLSDKEIRDLIQAQKNQSEELTAVLRNREYERRKLAQEKARKAREDIRTSVEEDAGVRKLGLNPRGLDMAWAWCKDLDDETLHNLRINYENVLEMIIASMPEKKK